MKIVQVKIRRYRAFDKQVTITLQALTVLTGPNNLGKSTILSALDLFFSISQNPHSLNLYGGPKYEYQADYPKRSQGRAGRRWPTEIRVSIELTADDKKAIAGDEAIEIPDQIEFCLKFETDEFWGRYTSNLDVPLVNGNAKNLLLSWLSNNVRYVYIPATRNVEDFRKSVFSELLSGAIHRVSRSKQRIQAIERLYNDVLDEVRHVETELANELRNYLPDVSELKFVISDLNLERLISVQNVEIDDGARTALEQKGDGFKSLFSMSVLQYIARQQYGRNLVFGIEEPEAHLHSSAIYEIKSTLRSLSEAFQVVITTHSPILIQRDDPTANIVIEQVGGEGFASTTSAARSLAQIRRSLGIRPQENMTTAEVVVVVEGAAEEKVLPRLLVRIRPELNEAIAAGRIRVLSAQSATKIDAVVRALARDATSCVVLVDADKEGLKAADRIRGSGLLKATDVFQVPARDGCRETEFEDVFDPSLYLDQVGNAAGFQLSTEEFESFRRSSGGRQTRVLKWSGVMKIAANQRGRDWSSVSENAKTAFATAIVERAGQIPADELDWVRAIARQISSYLREEMEVG